LTYNGLTGKTESQAERRVPERNEEAAVRKAEAHFGRCMRETSFDSTPEFKHFKTAMRGVLAVNRKRLDELVRAAKVESPPNGDPDSPGKKRVNNAKMPPTNISRERFL